MAIHDITTMVMVMVQVKDRVKLTLIIPIIVMVIIHKAEHPYYLTVVNDIRIGEKQRVSYNLMTKLN